MSGVRPVRTTVPVPVTGEPAPGKPEAAAALIDGLQLVQIGVIAGPEDAALAHGAAVLVQGTQPRNLSDAQRALLAQVDASLASSIGACFVEVRSAVAAADGRIAAAYDAGDGVHLNDAGHALIYARIKAVLDGGNCVKVR